MVKVREPIQKRSIEKKEKIIKIGFDLICEKGYYNTNTAEIAKKANVSTGIIYQYFNDKHDILIQGIKKYSNGIFFPILDIDDNYKINKKDFKKKLKEMILDFINKRKISSVTHQEIMSMYYTDKEVHELFINNELEMTNKLVKILINNGYNSKDLKEKVHLSISIIDNICHEIVFHKHKEMDYEKMIDISINIIDEIIKK